MRTRSIALGHTFPSLRVIAGLLALTALLSGCDTYTRLKAAARVDPFLVRDQLGAGGYTNPKDTEADVADLRMTQPKPVDLDTLKLPGETIVSKAPTPAANDSNKDVISLARNAPAERSQDGAVAAHAPTEIKAVGTPNVSNLARPQKAEDRAPQEPPLQDAATAAQQPAAAANDTSRPSAPAVNSESTAYSLAADDPLARNRLQDYLLTRSDEICLVHKSDILAISSTLNASFSGLTTILGGVGSIVTGVNAARALAGTAAISNGIRDDLNENVYYNNFASAIVRQIETQRKQKLQEIEPKRAKLTDEYSVEAAVRDVVEYHNLCSFSEAIAALATESKRPLTSDELTGKLQNLRAQLTANQELIKSLDAAGNQGAITSLESTNKVLAGMIQSTTLQLGLANSVSAAAPPSAAENSATSPKPDKSAAAPNTSSGAQAAQPSSGQ
ncbi:MAG TPA: hypothetical protein VN682_20460 [Terriglobales bacterium]|nr:hypothetical protein [Terriglobales bacterium]